LQSDSISVATLERDIVSAGGGTDAKSLLVSGCSIELVSDAGIRASITALKHMGCDAQLLKNGGADLLSLKDAGFDALCLF
jgi:hypothetical protein